MTGQVPTVSVVIPTFNRKDMVTRLINSIKDGTYKDLEIIVVDDCSVDGTADHLRKTYPDIIVQTNQEKGYLAGSRNNGAKLARGRYIFFIDDDNIVNPSCIEILTDFMNKTPECGICGPFIYYYPNKDVLRFAGCERVGTFTKIIGLNLKREKANKKFPSINVSEDMPNSLMVRSEITSVHGIFFDRKNFPIHYDESDFAKRAQKLNFKVFTIKEAEVYHDENKVFGLGSVLRNLNLDNPMRAYYNIRGKMLFHRIYSSRSAFPILFLGSILPISIVQMGAIVLFAGRSEGGAILLQYLKGMKDGFLLERQPP